MGGSLLVFSIAVIEVEIDCALDWGYFYVGRGLGR